MCISIPSWKYEGHNIFEEKNMESNEIKYTVFRGVYKTYF